MEEERICALCEEELEEDDEGHILKDGRLVCDGCFEYSCAACDDCGEYVEEDDLEYWGDDYRLCEDCFKQYFPSFDEKENEKETAEAYEAMLKRMIGKKTNREDDYIEIETDMDDDSFRYYIEVWTDEEGKICNISRLRIERCQSISIKSETWLDYPVKPSDYDADGKVENLIRAELDILDDGDEQ